MTPGAALPALLVASALISASGVLAFIAFLMSPTDSEHRMTPSKNGIALFAAWLCMTLAVVVLAGIVSDTLKT